MTQYLVAIHHPDDYLNSAVIPGEILEMKLRKIDEWATKKNSIYREVWLLQGNEISPVFVRTIYAMDLRRLIDQRGGVAAHEAESLARQTGEAKQISEARIQSFMLKVMRLQSKWRRKIEIEASELELAEHSVRGTPTAEQQAKSKKGRPPDKLSTSRRQVRRSLKPARLARHTAKLSTPTFPLRSNGRKMKMAPSDTWRRAGIQIPMSARSGGTASRMRNTKQRNAKLHRN